VFLGQYTHTLDAKGRLTVPARFRSELASGMVITRGFQNCLAVYPQEEWHTVAERMRQMPSTSTEAMAIGRLLFSQASEANLDSAGRILIPAFLRHAADIDQEAVVAGMNARFEIWNPDRWRERLEQDLADMDTTLAQVARMGL